MMELKKVLEDGCCGGVEDATKLRVISACSDHTAARTLGVA